MKKFVINIMLLFSFIFFPSINVCAADSDVDLPFTDGKYDDGSNDFYWSVPDYVGSSWVFNNHDSLFDDDHVFWSKYAKIDVDKYPNIVTPGSSKSYDIIFCTSSGSSWSSGTVYYNFGQVWTDDNSEIVSYLCVNNNGRVEFNILSKSNINSWHNDCNFLQDSDEPYYSNTLNSSARNDINYSYLDNDGNLVSCNKLLWSSVINLTGNADYRQRIAVAVRKMKVFSDSSSAAKYLLTGILDKDKLISDGKGFKFDKDGNNCYLSDFKVRFHDSNRIDYNYLDFSYSIPEPWKSNDIPIYLNIDNTYRYEYDAEFVVDEDLEYSDSCYIDVRSHPYGFKLYLKDLPSCKSFLNSDSSKIPEWTYSTRCDMLLGDNIQFGVLNAIWRTVKSEIILNMDVISGGFHGANYYFTADLLSGKTNCETTKPDSTGNYEPDSSDNDSDHYYTNVVVNPDGSVTSTNTVIKPDGSVINIDEGDTNVDVDFPEQLNIKFLTPLELKGVNINVDSGGSGGSTNPSFDINWQPDEDESNVEAVENGLSRGFGLLDKESDVFKFFKQGLSFLPSEILIILGAGLGVATFVTFIRILRG